MQSWSLFLLLPFLYAKRITDEENEEIRQDCGAHFLQTRRARSYDGYKTRPYEYPFMAAIKVYKSYDQETTGCTAVQISRRHFLTAAHCVIQKIRNWEKYCQRGDEREHTVFWDIPAGFFYIYVGTECTHPELCKEPNMFRILNITRHKDYNPCTRENDLAVIELDTDISRVRGIPICMPEEYEPLETTLTAIGYGLDPEAPKPATLFNWLQAVDLSLKEVAISRKMIRTQTPKRSICTGDSGGPLIRTNDQGKHVIVGITSSMKPHCEVSYLRVYDRDNYFADVRAYVHWICDQTGVCPVKQQNREPA